MTDIKGQSIKDTSKRQQIRRDVAVIKDETIKDIVFLNKKTERLMAAMLLVADLIKDTDVVIKDIIMASLRDVAEPITLHPKTFADLEAALRARQFHIESMASLIQVGKLSGRFSVMNANILREETRFIRDHIEKIVTGLYANSPITNASVSRVGEYEIPEDFFVVRRVDEGQAKSVVPKEASLPKEAILGGEASVTAHEGKPLGSGSKKDQTSIQSKTMQPTTDTAQQRSAKQERKVKIIGLLSRLGEASIKDITAEFPGVSEKTIQRDLSALIKDETVESEGKRRWMTYKLA